MEWKFRNDIPIYSQLIAQIKQGIASGILRPGERLASVRDMAMEAGVNPNTMQRALQELERDGMVYAVRTSGRFVTEDKMIIEAEKKRLASGMIRAFIESMSALGFSREEIGTLVAESIREEENDGNTGM